MANINELEWWHHSTVIRFLLPDFSSDNFETSDWYEGETIYACITCGCKFHNELDLDRHLSMKVVYINFKCEHCGPLSMFNRCELIYHVYGHGEPVKAFNLSDIQIAFLPPSIKDVMGTIRFNKFPSKFIYTTDKTDKIDVIFISKYKYASYSMLEEFGFAIVGSAITSNKVWTANQGDVLGYLYHVPQVIEIRFKDTFIESSSEIPECETSTEIQQTVCTECKTVVNINLDLHLNPGNKFWDSRIRCKYCQTVLATNCQLSAHERIHMKKAPFVCPECGNRFINYDELFDHFLTHCLHLVKSAYFNCPEPLCRRVYTVVENLMGHIHNYHVEKYAYCASCSLMCVTKDLLNQHQVQCDVVTVYKCNFCKDSGNILYDIRSHLTNEHRMLLFARYGYYCTKCKRRNMELPTYTNHLKECNSDLLKKSRFRNQIHIHSTNIHNFIPDSCVNNVDIEYGNQNISSDHLSEDEEIIDRSTSDIVVFNESTLNAEVFGESSLTVLQSNKENLRVKSSGEGTFTMSTCTEGSSPERISNEGIPVLRSTDEETFIERPCIKKKKTSKYHSEIISKMQLVNNVNSSDLKKFSENNLQLTNAKINVNNELPKKNIFNKFADVETEIINESLCDKDTIILSKDVQNTNSEETDGLFFAHSNEENKNNKNNDIVESEEGNVFNVSKSSSKDRLISKAKTKLSQKKINIQMLGKTKEIYKCGVCTYSSSIKKDFETHLFEHKMNNTEYQCLECGVCFAVKPTFAKHLIASHRIMDVEHYINTHDCIDLEAIEDLRLRSVNPNCKKDQFDENECCVCEEKFGSKKELDLHLRVHGMVYLTKNKFGKTNKI